MEICYLVKYENQKTASPSTDTYGYWITIRLITSYN